MDSEEYSRIAESTSNKGAVTNDAITDARALEICNWAMGLAGEVGELVDYLKKCVFHGHEIDNKKVLLELGDILWYITMTGTVFGLTLHSIMRANNKKLLERYKKGFKPTDSIFRDTSSEEASVGAVRADKPDKPLRR